MRGSLPAVVGALARARYAAVRFVVVGAVVAATPACGTKGDVSLSVYAQNPTLTKGSNAFGAKLDGSVDIVFDAGHYSVGPVHVEAITLGLVHDDAAESLALAGRARFIPSDAGLVLPFDVAPGEKKTVHYKIAGSSPTEPLALSAAEATEVCATRLKVSGTVQQQGRSAPFAIGTAAIVPSGCP